MYDQRYCPFQATSVHTEAIPRSHCYPSSDGSDAGSPRGGGSAGSTSPPSTYQHERSQEDSPFHPSCTTTTTFQQPPRRGFTLPPEYQLPGSLYSATHGFSGDTQLGIHTGQYDQFHHGPTYHLPIIGLGQPQQGLAPFTGPPQVGPYHPHSHHSHHQHREETTSSSSLSSTQSSRLGSPSISATAPRVSGTSFPDAGDYLRHQLGLQPGEPVSLDCIPDPPPGRRPTHPIPILVKLAIYGSPNKKLTLKGIYDTIENRFEYFKNDKSGAWKRSIRHNLSLNQVFRNTARPITEPGKGSYWELDVSQGEGYKRTRKRRNKKTQQRQTSQGQESESECVSVGECSDTSSMSRSESPSGRSRMAAEVTLGPFRTVHAGSMARRSSPYPQSDAAQTRVTVAPIQTYAVAESSRSAPPQAWAGQGMGQILQPQYHQPQPYQFATLPFGQDNQNPQAMFGSVPMANTMGWQAQMRSTSAPSQIPYHLPSAPSLSSPISGPHGQNDIYGLSAVPQGRTPYPVFGQNQAFDGFEGYDTETIRQSNQGDGRRYQG